MNTKEIELVMDDMNAEMAALKATYKEKMQTILQVAFKAYFESCPEVTTYSWRQYTPYFNDGEACTFRCYVDCGFVTNATDYSEVQYGEYDGEEEGVWIDDPDYGDLNEELIPAHVVEHTANLRRMLARINEDVFLEMFGDHCKVYATRDGFDIEEYEHD